MGGSVGGVETGDDEDIRTKFVNGCTGADGGADAGGR